VSSGSKKVVLAALVVNVSIATLKFVSAAIARSSAMLAEACHSLADCANQVFLLIGLSRSRRPPNRDHPFGYAGETYFWSFIVALCIFAVGGGVSIHEGVEKIWHRHAPQEQLGDVRSAFAVLGCSLLLETYSLLVALKEFRHLAGGRSFRQTRHENRDPTVLTVLFEDLAALFGLLVALLGLGLAHMTGDVLYDGLASIVVGLALVFVAVVLGSDAKALLIGRSMSEGEEQKIIEIVEEHPDVKSLVHLRTLHLGPHEVMAAIKIRFADALDVKSLEESINRLERTLREKLPLLRRIYIEPGFEESMAENRPDAQSGQKP
jgi:cation diffusion facilitator family transporter